MADIKTEIDQFRVDMELAHDIIHGDDTVQVTTESGQRNSFARDVKEQLIIPNNDTAANMSAAQLAETGAQAAEANALANKTAAATSATSATTKAAEALTHKIAAEAAKVAAQAAEAGAQAAESNAVAVVSGGTASLTPEPGKIPLADANGEISLHWLGADVVAKVGMLSVRVGDIGRPGYTGFGVGICPGTPAGFSALAGTYAIGSDEYGNYKYSDGSVMVWVPAFYYRIGHASNPTFAGYGVNSVDIQPLSAYADTPAANAAGYAVHRAFIDGGSEKPGFMYDKYQASNNGGIASSIKHGNPLSSNSAHNPFSGLIGTPANNYGGAWAAAKTRGADFFVASRFMRGALALLALAHGQAATGTAQCAWYDAGGSTNFPKGCNNNALGDSNDGTISYASDGYSNCGKTGSGQPFAKTTHNGQACGIADLNGNMWMIEQGITCLTTSHSIVSISQANPASVEITTHGLITGAVVMMTGIGGMTELNDRVYTGTVTDADHITLNGVDSSVFTTYTSGGTVTAGQWYVAAEATAMKDVTGGNTLSTDHFGTTGVAAMMQPIAPPFRTDYPENSFSRKVGNGANQVLASSAAGDEWLLTGLGMPKPDAISAAGTTQFGQDYFFQYVRNELCVISGADWVGGSRAGAWASSWSNYRTDSNDPVGLRAASYPV